jgi:hypothetical protein
LTEKGFLGMKSGFIATVALAVLVFAAITPAHATSFNVVKNGGFEQTTTTGSAQIGTAGVNGQNAVGWTTTGYNYLFTPGTADTTGANGEFGNLQLWGPSNGSANGLTATSPAGGNFLALDGAFDVAPVQQTLFGLTPGQSVTVTFYWAGAQQHTFDGENTEQMQVSLGDQTQSTSVYDNSNHGFSGWQQETMTFTATSDSEVLSFLAVGTPSGVPPFTLLDGVTAMAATPEPSSIAFMLTGLAGVGGMMRTRFKKSIS